MKDLDFGQQAVFVREGKGGKDRVAMLPGTLAADLRGPMDGMAVRSPLDQLAPMRAAGR